MIDLIGCKLPMLYILLTHNLFSTHLLILCLSNDVGGSCGSANILLDSVATFLGSVSVPVTEMVSDKKCFAKKQKPVPLKVVTAKHTIYAGR